MPDDLLLPAFLLTLVANAVLVVVAIRVLTRNRAERDRDTRWTGMAEERAKPRPRQAPTGALPGGPLPQSPTALAPATSAEPTLVAGPTAPTEPTPVAEKASSSAPEPPAAPGRRRRATARPSELPPPYGASSAPSGGATSRAGAPRAGASRAGASRAGASRPGRRRFSLPPLDDDHERVSRSIESFLSGADLPDGPETGPSPAPAPVATTIAVVAIHGIVDEPPTDRARREAVETALATVERTLRSAARTADRVMMTGPGRYRVVLPATGELAARSYLRRVRATVDPSLEAVDAPLVLATATTAVLDEPVAAAAARADARLDMTLAGLTRRAADMEPRVAGD